MNKNLTLVCQVTKIIYNTNSPWHHMCMSLWNILDGRNFYDSTPLFFNVWIKLDASCIVKAWHHFPCSPGFLGGTMPNMNSRCHPLPSPSSLPRKQFHYRIKFIPKNILKQISRNNPVVVQSNYFFMFSHSFMCTVVICVWMWFIYLLIIYFCLK